MGNLSTHDRIARAFATAVPCVVVAVDYRCTAPSLHAFKIHSLCESVTAKSPLSLFSLKSARQITSDMSPGAGSLTAYPLQICGNTLLLSCSKHSAKLPKVHSSL